MTFVALLIGAYALGSIPLGVLVARAQGIDLSKVGSGNVGATNVARALGPGWALLVLLFDMAKGFAPSFAATMLFAEYAQERAFAAGMAAVLGHCVSPWLRFRGGKGIATGLGALMGSSPAAAATALGTFLIFFGFTSIVSLSSLIATATLPVSGVLLREPAGIVIAYGALLTYILFRHIPNIRRLAKGEEPRFPFRKSDRSSAPPDAAGAGKIQPSNREESAEEDVESMEPEEGKGEEPEDSEHAVRRTRV